jgi:hypothetical protein
MGENAPDLLVELKTLRKGRGVNSPSIDLAAMPGLRGLGARQKLVERLTLLARTLPPDLAVAAEAALALHPEARHTFLAQRTEWLSERIQRDARTARRRMDEALALLAEQGGAEVVVPRPRDPATEETHYLEELHVLIRLDQPTPEAHERRLIVATQDGLREVSAMLTLPRDPTSRDRPHDLDIEVLYGVTLIGRERDTGSRFRFALQLPKPLRAGEKHEYGLVFRVPPRQPIRNHYVLSSYRRCDLFELRVRFDPERLPERIWPVDRAYPRDVDDAEPDDEIALDGAGELHLRFPHLQIGRMYGAKWQPGAAYRLEMRSPAQTDH